MANLANSIQNTKGFKPLPLGSNRDRRTAIILVRLSKLNWKLLTYGAFLTISLGYFYSIALSKGGIL